MYPQALFMYLSSYLVTVTKTIVNRFHIHVLHEFQGTYQDTSSFDKVPGGQILQLYNTCNFPIPQDDPDRFFDGFVRL